MSRPKEFDPELVMQEAMEAFWEHGYNATSVRDLLAEMKLNRGSLYGTFGDKKQLFLAALDRYAKQGFDALQEILDRPGPAKANLVEWIRTANQTCIGEAGQRGCLAAKAAMELAPSDPDVAQWMRNLHERVEHALAAVVRRGQGEGEINPSLDPIATARFLMVSMSGLRSFGVISPPASQVREVVELMLKILD